MRDPKLWQEHLDSFYTLIRGIHVITVIRQILHDKISHYLRKVSWKAKRPIRTISNDGK